MKLNPEAVNKAAQAIEALCLACVKHSDGCYVAIAKRSISTINRKETNSGTIKK